MKKDLGLAHFAEPTPDGLTIIWHQHRDTGFPCGYAVVDPNLAEPTATTGWLRCPLCGNVGRIVKGRWEDDHLVPTIARDFELVLAIPV